MTHRPITVLAVLALGGALCGSVLAFTHNAAKDNPVFVALYYRGAAWIEGKSPFEQPTIREHIQHHERLGDRLIGAAPFATDSKDSAVGMVLLFAESDGAARAWAKADPAVAGKVMDVKVYRWRISRLWLFPAATLTRD